ncbi:putative oxidoreductase [Favolaschia claudopus]|uniref:Oxidoreductase n=1 Tax=Favolaschia claudopus TaxID=2862362 RepID=A0AAW0D5Q2_9AGAR
MDASKQQAFLGMGAMGRGMAAQLAMKGGLSKPILLWNRTHKTAVKAEESIGGNSARAVESLVEIVREADIVWSCLYDQPVVERVYEEILEKVDLVGKVVVECSTITPEGADGLARRVVGAGGRFVTMPVFGSPSMAAGGQLSCITAGPAADVEAIKSFLVGVMGKAHIDLSDQTPGKAQELKLCGNIFNFTTLQQLAEFYTMVEKAGIGAKRGHQLVQALFPPGTPQAIYGEGMVTGRSFDTQNIVVDVEKTLHIAEYVNALADRNGVPLKAYNLAVDNIRAVGDRGDFTAVYGVVREQSGLLFVPNEGSV